jgi:hypothetical protein
MHFDDSTISYKRVSLPKILIGLWISKGWAFMNEYPLDNDPSVAKFLYWYLLSRNIEIKDENLSILIYKNFLERFHSFSDPLPKFSLTPMQNLIFDNRKDLSFSKEYFEIDFQKWWIKYGADEYSLKRYPLRNGISELYFDTNYIKELYIELFESKENYYKEINNDFYNLKILKILEIEERSLL